MTAARINNTWRSIAAIKHKKNGAWVDHTALYARSENSWYLVDLDAEQQDPAYHVWMAYADDANGTNASLNSVGKAYIGFATGRTSETVDLSDLSVFVWSLFKGADGTNIVGESAYFHIAYADDAVGTGFSQSAIGKSYIGTYTDNTLADSSDPTDYEWMQAKGGKGDKGDKGDTATVVDNGDGTYTITGLNGSITIQDGQNPTITDNGDGTKSIDDGNGHIVVVYDGEDGYSPIKGTDYNDGDNGDYVSFVFAEVVTGNPAPTVSGGSYNGSAETIPSGWLDNPVYTNGKTTYMAMRRYSHSVATGLWSGSAWSTPKVFADKGDKGDKGDTGVGTVDEIKAVTGWTVLPFSGATANSTDLELLNSASGTAQTKADAAELAAIVAAAADASSKQVLAETTAAAYADGIVTAEETRAIADATAKANAAELAAKNAAALDATAKADAAEANILANPQVVNNMLDVSSWVVGTNGSQGKFTQNGSNAENKIVIADSPSGNQEPVWESVSDGDNSSTGGWNHDSYPADGFDHTKAYRCVVWAKQDSDSGTIYLGCLGSETYNLDNTVNGNPYFFAADLPQHNKWYLIVGIIHGSSYTGTDTGVSGVYDPDTGLKVIDASEFKNKVGATAQRHRVYSYYATTVGATKWFTRPRFEEINGNEPSLVSLLDAATVGATIGTNLSGGFTSGNISSYFAASVIGASIIDVTNLFAQTITASGTITGANLVGGSYTTSTNVADDRVQITGTAMYAYKAGSAAPFFILNDEDNAHNQYNSVMSLDSTGSEFKTLSCTATSNSIAVQVMQLGAGSGIWASTESGTGIYVSSSSAPYTAIFTNFGSGAGARILSSSGVAAEFFAASGSAPFTVSNANKVVNLNADLLDGYYGSSSSTGNTYVLRDGSGHIYGNYFFGTFLNMSHSQTTRNSDSIFYSSTDNYVRKNTASGFRTALNVYSKSDVYTKTEVNNSYAFKAYLDSVSTGGYSHRDNNTGFTIKTGRVYISSGNTNATVYFTNAFTTIYTALASDDNSDFGEWTGGSVISRSNSQLTVQNQDNNSHYIDWIAIGYTTP